MTPRPTWRLLLPPLLLLLLAGCDAAPPAEPRPSATPSTAASTVAPAPSTPAAAPSPSPAASATMSPRPSPRPPRFTAPPVALTCAGATPVNLPPAAGAAPPGTIRTTGSQAVALTFDDGPDPVNTPKVLDLLRQCGVKATFCVNGVKAQQHPGVIRRIHAEGHTFCNHTWRHLTPLGGYGKARIKQDLEDTNRVLRSIVPGVHVSYFRAPGGAWTPDYIAVCQELGMTPAHWHVDTRDWESAKYGQGQSMVSHIIRAVQNDTRPGSIVLMHDYQKPDTTTALRTLLPWLKARFTLIALPDGGLPAL